MYNFQKKYDNEKKENYGKFIKNKLEYMDYDYDFENGDDKDIFKVSSGQIVDLENFSTIFDQKFGADLMKHYLSTNIDNSLIDLIAHLKSKPKYKIVYEKLTGTILAQVNDISNKDLENFHRNVFMEFRNLTSVINRQKVIVNTNMNKFK